MELENAKLCTKKQNLKKSHCSGKQPYKDDTVYDITDMKYKTSDLMKNEKLAQKC